MLWWDWTAAKKVKLSAAMLGLAAVPGLLFGWLTQDWRAFLGGTAFLLIPQIVGWFLFAGLKTGRMPVRGGDELRADSPIWFWIVAAMYGGVLLMFCWFVLVVLIDS